MNNDVATITKELGELKELLNEFSTDFKEVKALLHGIRLDLNQLAKTNNLSLASHELEERWWSTLVSRRKASAQHRGPQASSQ